MPACWAAERRALMKNRASLPRFLFTGILAGLMTFSVGAARASAVTVTSPNVSEIANQVQHNLAMLPWYGVFDHLDYQVNGTEVILNGQVISEHATTKDDAGKYVNSIPGVTKVVNNIEVLPPSIFDNQIRRAEYRTVFSQGDLGRYTAGAIPQVHIIVKNGHVSLEGVVMNQMDKNMAGIFANSVPGVFSVENNLRIG
jgi:hyperosmotically inducible protein